jgi:alcohol dehydrogenase class IV
MSLEFATAGRIVFGCGTVGQTVDAAKRFGKRALIVTGRSSERAARITRELDCVVMPVAGEPTLDTIRAGVARVRESSCDVVIAFGGGSAIDAGKTIAAMAANPGDVLDYIEVIGTGKPLSGPPLPFIAVPTTAGTGSEVTRNAVLGSPEHHVKASLRSLLMLPRVAIVDPELTLDLPKNITASTGLDALTQLIEPYVSSRANPMTDMFCVEGMRRASNALARAYRDGQDREARTHMAFASLLGGSALANAGLGIVHGFAAPIGGMFPAPHGAVCAALLPYAMDANIRAMRSRAPESRALERYDVVARLLRRDTQANADDGVTWVRDLCRELEVPPLRTYGIADADIPVLVDKAANASSMKANPIQLTPDELRETISAAL